MNPLELSSCAARLLGPNALMPAASRSSTIPAASGASGPTTTKSTVLRLAEVDHRRMVGDVERHAFGFPRDAGIARRAPQFCQQWGSGDFPRQSVFAAAGTEQKDVHGSAAKWRVAGYRATV